MATQWTAGEPARRRALKNDLALYDEHADDWWDPESKAFRSLHRINAYLLGLLRDWLAGELRGRTVVDLGCGGGLLAEALAREGARVVGVDQSLPSLRAARAHAREQRVEGCAYVRGDLLRSPLGGASARIVLLADVVEHLGDPGAAVREAARLLAPGGKLFVSTLNRTWRSRWWAVTVAEGLGLVPRGTHDPRLFVAPRRLEAEARAHALRPLRLQGSSPRLAATWRAQAIELRSSDDTSVLYSALFEKGEKGEKGEAGETGATVERGANGSARAFPQGAGSR